VANKKAGARGSSLGGGGVLYMLMCACHSFFIHIMYVHTALGALFIHIRTKAVIDCHALI